MVTAPLHVICLCAAWCGTCRDYAAVIDTLRAEFPALRFSWVDVEDQADVVDLARLTLEHAWQVRYIELMPFGGISEFQRAHIVSEDELRATIEAALGPMDLQNQGKLDGEARIFRLRGAKGTLGFISSVTKPFCAGCNRVRLTADGKLRLCLLRDKEVDLLTPLRAGAGATDLELLIRQNLWEKPWGHGLEQNQFATDRVMSEIGG